MQNDSIGAKENVTVVLKDAEGNVTNVVKGKNIVTDAGDIAYAQKIVSEATSFDTPSIRLGTGSTAVTKADTDVETFIAGSNKAVDVGFPQRNNVDPGNVDGGVDVITWKFSYALGDLDQLAINEGAIVDDGTTPTTALNHFLFQAPFDVSATDQLTVYVNHTLNGIA